MFNQTQNTINFKNNPEFRITVIGLYNSTQLHFWRQELLRVQEFLQFQSRKKWNMQLSCKLYQDYELIERKNKLSEQWSITIDQNPIILTENRIFTTLNDFYVKYLKLKLGVTEMTLFKQFQYQELEPIILEASHQQLIQQLTPNDQRQFGYVKLFDDDTNDIFSILFQINIGLIPIMSNIVLQFFNDGIFNDSQGKKLQFLEQDDFQTGESHLQGGFIEIEKFQKLKGTGFRDEIRILEHNKKGVFGLCIEDDEKGQIKRLGFSFEFQQNPLFDSDSSLMFGLGQILYGYEEAQEYCTKVGFFNQKVNLRTVECEVYKYNPNDFELNDQQKMIFNPKTFNNEGYRQRKYLREQERIRLEKEREEAERLRLEEEKRMKELQEKIEEEKLRKEQENQRKLKKQARKQKGEDVTSSEDEDDYKQLIVQDDLQFQQQQQQQQQSNIQDGEQESNNQDQVGIQHLQKQSSLASNQATQGTTFSTGETTELPTFALMIKQSAKVEENKVNLEEIDEEYEIDEDNLTFLYELGKGSFGSVVVVLDKETGIRYAQKVFTDVQDFVEERDLMQKLEDAFEDDFEDIGAAMEKYDNKSKTIYYDCGACSLHELMQVRSKYKVHWFTRETELVFILKEVLKLFQELFKKGIYHTDLKPANIILKKFFNREKPVYYIKLIDFGSACFEYQQIHALTKDYYHPNFESMVPFKSPEVREKLEIYSLGRTIQAIMLSSIWEIENSKDRAYFENSDIGIEESIEKLKAYYSEELCEIINDILQLKDLNEIQQKLNELTGEEINDKENLISRILSLKQEESVKQTGLQQQNIYEELQSLWDSQLVEMALTVIKKYEENIEELYQDLRLVNWKIKFMKKVGMFAKTHSFIGQVTEYYKDKEKQEKFIKIRNSEDPDVKYSYHEFRHYQAWKKSISAGRFEEMDKIHEDLIEDYTEDSVQEAFWQFWSGWLNLGDKRYDISINHFNKSAELYLKFYPNKDNLMLAEVYRYLGQDHYQKQEADKCLEIFEMEKDIRKNIQGENNAEYAVVLNSIASVYGNLKGQYQQGFDKILECLEIYQQTIGENNQNFVIALDWKGWYLNRLNRKDEAMENWEYAIVLAYKVFGRTYHVYKTMKDAHLWNLYQAKGNMLQRLDEIFIKKSEDLYQIEDYQNSQDIIEVAWDLLKRFEDYGHKYDDISIQIIDYLKLRINYRKKLVAAKLDQQKENSNIKALEAQKNILELINEENVMEHFIAIQKMIDIMYQLEQADEVEKVLKQHKEKVKQLYSDLEQDKLNILNAIENNEQGNSQSLSQSQKEVQNDENEEYSVKQQQQDDGDTKENAKEVVEDKGQKQNSEDNKDLKQMLEDKQVEDQTKKQQEIDFDKNEKQILEEIEYEQNKIKEQEEKEQQGEKQKDRNRNKKVTKIEINKENQQILEEWTHAELKQSLAEKQTKFQAIANQKNQKRLDDINQIFTVQRELLFKICLAQFHNCFALNKKNDGEKFVRQALAFANNKKLVNLGQASLLKILEYKKNVIEIKNKDIIQKMSNDSKLNFDRDTINKNDINFIFSESMTKIKRSQQSLNLPDNVENPLVFMVGHTSQKLPKQNFKFAFIMDQGPLNFVALGICQKQKMQKNNYQMRKQIVRSGHGLYMITSNNFCVNSTESSQNYQKIVPFTFGSSDIIICEYDFEEYQLKFTKYSTNESFALDVKLDKTKDYAIAVGLKNQFDEVQITTQLDMLKQLDSFRYNLQDIIKEQMQTIKKQIGKNSLKFQYLRIEIASIYYKSGFIEDCNKLVSQVLDYQQKSQKIDDFAIQKAVTYKSICETIIQRQQNSNQQQQQD